MSQDVIDQLLAQLEAHKQMLNEALNSNIVFRTDNILLRKKLSELNKPKEEVPNAPDTQC